MGTMFIMKNKPRSKSEAKRQELSPENAEASLVGMPSPTKHREKQKSTAQRATGASDEDLAQRLLFQALLASVPEAEMDKVKENPESLFGALQSVQNTLLGIAPKDELEGMIAVQMVGVHNLAMRLLERASRKQIALEVEAKAISQAQKLMRTFTEQIEALNRYRGKGQQKVTVEHVTVNSGGQAIVGVVDHNSSREGGGGVE